MRLYYIDWSSLNPGTDKMLTSFIKNKEKDRQRIESLESKVNSLLAEANLMMVKFGELHEFMIELKLRMSQMCKFMEEVRRREDDHK